MTVRLVTGPPGAGKNTYIEKHKKDGDVVFDFDILKDMAGGSLERAKVMREAFESDIQNYENDVWVIRCVADAAARTELAERLSASEVVVLETPAELAKQRVKERNRDPHRNEEVFTAIDDWWSQYGVVESHLIVKPDTGSPLSDRKQPMANTEHESSGPATDGTDRGFPAETKIADMTPEQQAAYWKYQSRKHEGNATNLKAQLDAKQSTPPAEPKKTEADPLDPAELRKQILAELKKEQAPGLVRNHFESLIGDRLPADRRDAILEDLDLAKFVKEDGSIDKDRIKTKAELIAPASTEKPNVRRQRSHQGNRQTGDIKPSVESGKALFEEFSKKR